MPLKVGSKSTWLQYSQTLVSVLLQTVGPRKHGNLIEWRRWRIRSSLKPGWSSFTTTAVPLDCMACRTGMVRFSCMNLIRSSQQTMCLVALSYLVQRRSVILIFIVRLQRVPCSSKCTDNLAIVTRHVFTSDVLPLISGGCGINLQESWLCCRWPWSSLARQLSLRLEIPLL